MADALLVVLELDFSSLDEVELDFSLFDFSFSLFPDFADLAGAELFARDVADSKSSSKSS